MLLEAFDIYERALCVCGHPSWVTYDEAHGGEFEMDHETVCQACKQVEEDKSERKPGEKPFVKHVAGVNSEPGAHEKRIAAKKAAAAKKPS